MPIQRPSTKRIGSLLFTFTILSVNLSLGQSRFAHYIKFTDKQTELDPQTAFSERALDRRKRMDIAFDSLDHPVNTAYTQEILKDTSLHYRYSLKWHNAVVVDCDRRSLAELKQHPFVSEVRYVGEVPQREALISKPFNQPFLKLKEDQMPTLQLKPKDYGKSYEQNQQIEADVLHSAGFDGTGVLVAVFDAGFKNLNTIPSFLKHQAHRKITVGMDLVDLDFDLFDSDNHGTSVTGCFGGYDYGKYIGSAPGASLVLFRTENSYTEYPIEELNWCKAAEIADSMGVDLITSSLGYTRYDEAPLSYAISDMDGKTSYASVGARTAVSRGILVFNSAGNEGNDAWYKVGTPADVEEVITVGSVDQHGNVSGFSSRGNNANGHLKPDVCALGFRTPIAGTNGSYRRGYGTSYATPIAAGGAACLVQALPNEHPKRIGEAIRMSARLNNAPDSLHGYGVAQFNMAKTLIEAQNANSKPFLIQSTAKELRIYSGDATTLSLEVTQKVKRWWFIKKKVTVFSYSTSLSAPIAYVDVEENKLKCNKLYTIQIKLSGGVEKHSFKINDLTLCSD